MPFISSSQIDTSLYFGCRSSAADYFFESEWRGHREKGVKIQVAASRDQRERLYVQHLIKRDKEHVKDWIVDKKGWLFISGLVTFINELSKRNFGKGIADCYFWYVRNRSSNTMPREVREAVAWCISKKGAGDMTEEESKAYVEQMFENKRGGEESW